MRGTDLPFNKRIQLPKPVDEQTEVRMQMLKHRLKNVTEQYVEKSKTKDKGNLSSSEHKALKSLQQKVNEKEIVIYETDKSGRFSVDTMDNYKLSCEIHIRDDKEITIKDYQEIENKANTHAISWARMCQAGTAQNDDKRIRENIQATDSQPPPLYTCRKDHKEVEDQVIGPPTRPICGVTGSATDRLSYILSSILSEVWKRDTSTVCMSTEELKAEIDKVNMSIGSKEIIIGSMDVKALYPSLDIPFTIDKVCEIINESTLQFENLWYDEISLYLAVNLTCEELTEYGLQEICHTRETNLGRPPTISSLQHKFDKRRSNWKNPSRQPNEQERRMMMIHALPRNHLNPNRITND